jgi:hypothetical protein
MSRAELISSTDLGETGGFDLRASTYRDDDADTVYADWARREYPQACAVVADHRGVHPPSLDTDDPAWEGVPDEVVDWLHDGWTHVLVEVIASRRGIELGTAQHSGIRDSHYGSRYEGAVETFLRSRDGEDLVARAVAAAEESVAHLGA